MKIVNAVVGFDFTAYLGEDEQVVIDLMKKYCKKWTFQLEKCPSTDRLHFQGRMKLMVKERPSESLFKKFPGFNLTITSKASVENDWYACKEDTRVKGPWKDTDTILKIPRDIAEIEELWLWQLQLIDIIKVYDARRVNVVYDPVGNSGKSTFVRYCMCYGLGQILPFCNDYKDVMRMVMDMPDSKCYFMDMPRAINKERLFGLYGGIESVKGGYAYDDRYHFKQKLFDPPNVVIFTNKYPDEDLLSRDRWRIWEIIDRKLVKFEKAEVKLEDVL